jgi:hypothetical protein
MNIEKTKEAIRIMQAFVNGKEVEVQLPAGNWETMAPNWNWRDTQYRIKPIPTFRPWNAGEVPLGTQMRDVSKQDYRWLIHTSGNEDVRKEWLVGYEHSTDGGKTWKECGVMEEAK